MMTSESVSGGGADGRVQSQLREVARKGSVQHTDRVGLASCSELSLDVRNISCFIYYIHLTVVDYHRPKELYVINDLYPVL